MQRIIKFRAWDITRKEMVRVRQIIIPDGNNENGLQEISVSGLKFGTNPSYWLIAPPLMAYTGLKDKNGKEIYEGDIVRQDTPFTNLVKGIGVVFDQQQLQFGVIYSDGGDCYFLPLCDIKGAWEILGNIYESPELLEAE